MKYISHLDLLRLFSRATRRSNLPISLSCGFNPHPRIRIKRALKLGLEDRNLEADFLLEEKVEAGDFKRRLQKQLPEGIKIKRAVLVPVNV